MPGSWGLAAIGKKSCRSSPQEDWNFCDIGVTNVKETRLGEPVLIGRAIKRGWGEPSNEVGASPYSLGEPSRWASQAVGRATQPRLLQSCALVRCLVPARHCACSARLVKCQLGTCPLGTGVPTSARSALLLSARSAPGFLQVPARHCASSARARSAHLVTSARSAHLVTSARSARARSALPGARSALLVTGARSAPPCLAVLQLQDEPTYGRPDRKKTGRGHGVEPHAHVMRKDVQHATPCEKTCKNHAKSCHAKSCHAKSCHAKSCHAKTMQKTSCSTCCKKQAVPHVMQKPCNMRRVRWRLHRASGAAGRLRRARQGGYAGRGNPLNIHSPPGPCYTCYMCYISQGKPLNIHSPPGPCYTCYMCYISQGKPLNIHSPPGPCYMYYMCYMAPI